MNDKKNNNIVEIINNIEKNNITVDEQLFYDLVVNILIKEVSNIVQEKVSFFNFPCYHLLWNEGDIWKLNIIEKIRVTCCRGYYIFESSKDDSIYYLLKDDFTIIKKVKAWILMNICTEAIDLEVISFMESREKIIQLLNKIEELYKKSNLSS